MATNMANKKAVILVLCGLPASGKSYISNLLIQSASYYNIHIFHVCYDDLIPSNLNLQSPVFSATNDSSSWKSYRKLIIRCMDKVISQYSGIKSTFEANDTVDKDLLSFDDFWEDFLKNQTTRKRSCCFENWLDACHVFLIDDNMFYRSMRHEYYVLARKYCLGYGQVFIDCPLETAVKNNNQRPNPVETKTIVTMATKIEPPLPEKFGWEINSARLDRIETMESPDSTLQKVFTLIRKASENPVQPVEEDERQKEKSRMELLASVLYQTDQTLRKVISEHMKHAKGGGYTKHQMKTLAEEENAKRKLFLEELKSISNLSSNESNQIYFQADFNHIDIHQHLRQLFAQTSKDNYMIVCHNILQTSVNMSHFDAAVKYMFEHYVYDNDE